MGILLGSVAVVASYMYDITLPLDVFLQEAEDIESVMLVLRSQGARAFCLMGDFNTDWQTTDSSMKYLAEQMKLSVFKPHADGLSTYGDKGARLDWILISEELEFSRYSVFPDVVSDHSAVAAEIVLKDKSTGSTDRMTNQ